MRFPLDQGALCFALILEIGVTVLISVNGVICFGSSLFNPGVVVVMVYTVVWFNSVVYAWLLSGSGWWIWWWLVDYFSCSSVFW